MTRYLAAQPTGGAGLNLLCFHHAGAGAMTFARWRQRIGPEIAVLPIRLPGRESRLREPRPTEAEPLIQELADELGPLLERPHAFYGHSMGAMVAYRLALYRDRHGAQPPRALLVGACPAPHRTTALVAAAEGTDDQLLSMLADTGSIPEQLLLRPEWLRTTLAVLRDDLRLARSLRAGPTAPLSCDIRAFAGLGDPVAPVDSMTAWRDYTTSSFELHTVPGAHFFVRDPATPRVIRTVLGAGSLVPAARPSGLPL